jgi:ribosomal protein S27AE
MISSHLVYGKTRESAFFFCRDAARDFSLAFSCYQPYAALRRSIFLWPHLATNLMPRCGEGFFFGLVLLPTLCRDAARDFSLASSCYQPYAAMRREIFHWLFHAKNLVPRCGEGFFFGFFLLRTLCRDAAKTFRKTI